ncbi:HD-GYP domain-containing protein [Bacillus sp. HMF5848]|uniref:HD-GYP domain-containing protein n=1 Tax=Bacillus sp. HMF5848 TaxID=2495421 RepID=UPI000F77986A|nr:HD-GYP domain-containing protein [Bacillus sp. HMF5848]RSK25442.1 HD-GYP domain-containing protein [Bacillus sp. HMF5848]
MRVSVKYLQPGCIVSRDVMSLSNRPIIPNKTVLTNELINILKAFLVQDIYVESTLNTGEVFRPIESMEEDNSGEPRKELTNFSTQYLQAVQAYKHLFISWQAGTPIDIAKVRSTIIPLLDSVFEAPSELALLHHFSTKEDYIYHHAISVALLASYIGIKLNYSKGDVIQLALAGLLSDAGMAKLDNRILKKTTSLTIDEFKEVKQHPVFSYRLVQNIPLLKDITKLAILQHHERNDGSGYPFGYTKDKLHQYSQIIAIADVFHAMTSERVYRSKQSPYRALEFILKESFGKFDLVLVQTLVSLLSNFSIGTKVLLTNGLSGDIIFVDSNQPTRPMIKTATGEIINLMMNRDVYIEEIL